jgi:tetratricopeptide (TPR) repeat protein
MNWKRMERSWGGGYLIRDTDAVTDAVEGSAHSVANAVGAGIGAIIGAAAGSIGDARARTKQRDVERELNGIADALDSDDFSRAFDTAIAFTKRYPDEADGYWALAVACAGLKKHGEAHLALNKCLELTPGDSSSEGRVALVRAHVFSGEGRRQDALHLYSQLTMQDGIAAVALLSRAMVLREIGDDDQALKDLERSISLSPDAKAYLTRATIHHARGDFQSALADASRAMALRPDSEGAYSLRAQINRAVGNEERAAEDEREAERLKRVRAQRTSVPSEPMDGAEAVEATKPIITEETQQHMNLIVNLLCAHAEGLMEKELLGSLPDVSLGELRAATQQLATEDKVRRLQLGPDIVLFVLSDASDPNDSVDDEELAANVKRFLQDSLDKRAQGFTFIELNDHFSELSVGSLRHAVDRLASEQVVEIFRMMPGVYRIALPGNWRVGTGVVSLGL